MTGPLTKRNIFYLNSVIGMLLIVSALILVRDSISIYVEKRKMIKETMHAAADFPQPERTEQLMEYAPILKNNPFGFAAGEIRPLTVAANQGNQATNVMLIGTVTGVGKLSYGVFKDNTGIQEIFRIGESVFGVGTLHAVEKDKAIIKKDSRSIEILLEDVRVKEIHKQASGTASSSVFAQKIGRGAYVVDQRKLQQAIANPAQMMTDARLRPNSVSGKDEGFILSEVKPGGIYQSLGLQDGDVLLRINDYDISNPERALQAFTALRGLDRVQVDLIRSGSRMTMTYQIQ